MSNKDKKRLIKFLVKHNDYLREIESVAYNDDYDFGSNYGYEFLDTSFNTDSTKWNKRLGF